MRAISLHPDVIVLTSRVWQTNCTVVRGPAAPTPAGGSAGSTEDAPGPEAFVIDSPVYPDELELIPALLEQAGFAFAGLLATHADWDHLLGRLAFAGASLGVAESTAARLTAQPGAAARELRSFDDRHYVHRAGPLTLGSVQALPVPGRLDAGAGELELHPTGGHGPDGMALWVPWAGVLIAGDYLSPVEIPMIGEGGSVSEYLATLERLRPLVAAAEQVVPGHGRVLAGPEALAVLEADGAYLHDLQRRGDAASMPRGERSVQQRRIHAENARRAAG